MFWKFQLFFYIKLINPGSFLKNDKNDPERNFFGVLKNLFDFGSENVCLHLKDPKKSFGARLFETQSYVLGRNRKKWTYMPLFVRTGLRY